MLTPTQKSKTARKCDALTKNTYGFLGLRFFIVAEPDIRLATLALIRPLMPLVRSRLKQLILYNVQVLIKIPVVICITVVFPNGILFKLFIKVATTITNSFMNLNSNPVLRNLTLFL